MPKKKTGVRIFQRRIRQSVRVRCSTVCEEIFVEATWTENGKTNAQEKKRRIAVITVFVRYPSRVCRKTARFAGRSVRLRRSVWGAEISASTCCFCCAFIVWFWFVRGCYLCVCLRTFQRKGKRGREECVFSLLRLYAWWRTHIPRVSLSSRVFMMDCVVFHGLR